MQIFKWFLWLIIYSFIGWAYESIICSVGKRRLINRGFLNGPICPVYGFGAVVSILMLYGRTENLFVLFVAGMFLTTLVEYITAWLLEKLFKAKWWDYSQRRFNIQGRVCLLGAVVFGILSVLLIKYIHPLVIRITALLSEFTIIMLAIGLFIGMVIDIFLSVRHLMLLNNKLKKFQMAFNYFREHQMREKGELKDALLERFEQNKLYRENIKRRYEAKWAQSIRMVLAYPKLRFLRYSDAWQWLKKNLNENVRK